MNIHPDLILLSAALLVVAFPIVQAADPAWIVPASLGVELSVVAISHDGSTIVAGGDQLIVIASSGEKLWSG